MELLERLLDGGKKATGEAARNGGTVIILVNSAISESQKAEALVGLIAARSGDAPGTNL